MLPVSSRRRSALYKLLTLYSSNGYEGSGEETSEGSDREDDAKGFANTSLTNGLATYTWASTISRVKFFWYKTEMCSEPQVLLSAPFSEEPVFLNWNGFKEVYESLELPVQCGTHSCMLHIGKESFWLDPFYVGPHTFEVSLYIAEEDTSRETESPALTTEDETDCPTPLDPEFLIAEDTAEIPFLSDHSNDLILNSNTGNTEEAADEILVSKGDSDLQLSQELLQTSNISAEEIHEFTLKTEESTVREGGDIHEWQGAAESEGSAMDGDALESHNIIRPSANYLKLVQAQLAASGSEWQDHSDGEFSADCDHEYRIQPVDRNANIETSPGRIREKEYPEIKFEPIRNGVDSRSGGRPSSSTGSGRQSLSSEQELSHYFDGEGGQNNVNRFVEHFSEHSSVNGWVHSKNRYQDSYQNRSAGHTPTQRRRRLDFSDPQKDDDFLDSGRRSTERGVISDHDSDRLSDSAGRHSSLSSLDHHSTTSWSEPSSQVLPSYSDQYINRQNLQSEGGREQLPLQRRSASLDRHVNKVPHYREPHWQPSDTAPLGRQNANFRDGAQRNGNRTGHDYANSGGTSYHGNQHHSPERDWPHSPVRDGSEPRRSPIPLHNSQQTENRLRDSAHDKYGAQPQVRPPLVTSRTTPLSSRASPATSTPVIPTVKSKPVKNDLFRVQDLEDTVISLKRVLTERENEVDELRSHQQSMEAELRQLRAGQSVQKEDMQRSDDFIRERENHQTDIYRLKEEHQQVEKQSSPHAPSGGSLENYDPNNPLVLQRKIRDMESQLADLHEAQETSAAHLQRTERQLQSIKDENEKLKIGGTTAADLASLKEENLVLRQKLEKSPQKETSGYLQHEVQQLRDDLRRQRDCNHQLGEENIRLKEQIRDLENTYIKRTSVQYTHNQESTQKRLTPKQQEQDFYHNLSDLDRGFQTNADKYCKERDLALAEVESLHKQLQLLQAHKTEQNGLHNYMDQTTERREDPHSLLASPIRPREVHLRDTDKVEEFLLSEEDDNEEDEFILIKGTTYPHLSSDPSASSPLSSSKHPIGKGNLRYAGEENQTAFPVATSPILRHSQEKRESNIASGLKSSKQVNWTSLPAKRTESEILTSDEVVEDVFDETPIPSTRGQSKQDSVESSSPDLINEETKKQETVDEVLARLGVEEKTADEESSEKHSESFNGCDNLPGNRTTYTQTEGPSTVVVPNGNTNLSPETKECDGCMGVNLTQNKDGKHTLSEHGNLNLQMNRVNPNKVHLKENCSKVSTSIPVKPESSKTGTNGTAKCTKNMSGVKAIQINPSKVVVCAKELNSESDLSDVSPAGPHDIGRDVFLDLESLGTLDRNRRDSFGSDCTDIILDEAEKTINLSNSGLFQDDLGDGKGGTVSPLPISSGSSPSTSSDSESWKLGSRPFSPKPILTQHNKAALGSSLSISDSRFSTNNKRPFAPRNVADISVGDVVKFSRQGGKISKGLVQFVGHLPGKHDTYLGVELEHEMGKHDGIYENHRYFQCRPNRGVFVAFSKVVMVWTSN